jgi:hypothetical protein
VTAHLGDDLRPAGELLADLRHQADELRRRLTDVQLQLDSEQAGSTGPAPGQAEGPGADPAGPDSSGDRTTMLLSHGRSTARRRLSRRGWLALASVAAVVLTGVLIAVLLAGRASWPSSVATVRREAAIACRNPDVRSEPGQINFACARESSQILWVFALLTSYDNPRFVDRATGRTGLEPITPAQGGELAWSLNLHHPYDPASPVDSLEVAARAINNIVGGATVTSTSGKLVVQPGLESSPQNCAKYTGSPALTTRQGFPALCARQVTSRSGRMALVFDIYRKWLVGATTAAAQDAAVLFGNADDPGDGRVQAILRQLSRSRQPA